MCTFSLSEVRKTIRVNDSRIGMQLEEKPLKNKNV